MPRKTKQCPFCAETIKAEAILCRYCGRDLPVVTPIDEKIEEKAQTIETPEILEIVEPVSKGEISEGSQKIEESEELKEPKTKPRKLLKTNSSLRSKKMKAISSEINKEIIIVIGLLMLCGIVIVVLYSMFIQPSSRKIIYVTPTVIDTSKASIPTTDGTLIGTYFDDYAPSMKFTTILKKVNGIYYKTEIFSDGSQGTKKLNVKIVNGEERFIEEGDDGYFGEYMVIENNRDIAFYDKQGFIYRLHPK